MVLKIGLLLGAPQIGGMERQASLLAKGLIEASINVDCFFLSPQFKLSNKVLIDFDFAPVTYLGLRRFRCFDRAISLAWHINKKRIDLLQMYNLESIELGLLALRFTKRCVGLAAVRGMKFIHDSVNEERYRRCLGNNIPITCNSKAIQSSLINVLNIDGNRISVINNGIVMPKDNLHVAVSKNKVPINILFAGSLKSVKDPFTFVKAVIEVQKRIDCKICIAGDGPLASEVKSELMLNLKPGSWVMLGRVTPDDVPYKDADIIVSSSLREGGSNTVLEAMAHGKPIVGTNVEATSSMINDSNSGILVQPQDSMAMSEVIIYLACNASLREKLGRNGRCYIEREYGLARMIDSHIKLYEDLTKS